MTEYLNTVTNPAAPWSFIDDTEENILQDLAAHTLDPIFELYGDFVNPSPEWLSTENAAKYAGCTMISGNFRAYTHASPRFPACDRRRRTDCPHFRRRPAQQGPPRIPGGPPEND